jgi:NAD-dependent dihydropyrimidine dehydrogenase PreA subunit
MRRFTYLKNVVTLELKEENCNGCGMCIKVCPHAVFEFQHRKVRITNRDDCMECGACALNCEQNAILVKSGVGCAAAIIQGSIRNTEPSCGCSSAKSSCS